MEQLIPTINRLQDVFSVIGSECVSLPQIVVIGSQSSGKSSVLENLLGQSFLPRGVGTVTRRPLILQLVNDNTQQEWGEFGHESGRKFTNFNDIRQEIEKETNRTAGMNKGISAEPIRLRIHSTKVVDLTLVDLPGLTKVPVGDQPSDIELRIRSMALAYISNPNAIILAVVTANTDMATSDGLQLAREVDSKGERTVAVVTKLDLMDIGTNASNVLTGRVIPVRLGIVGVVNRSQKDTDDKKTIQDTIKDEALYLRVHYPLLASRHGTPYLARTLNHILMMHIHKSLPDLKARVESLKTTTEAELRQLGEVSSQDGSVIVLQIITQFCQVFCAAINGSTRNLDTKELRGGARICFIFHETFSMALDSISPMMGLTDLEILTAMRNVSGIQPTLFVSERCLEVVIKRQIRRLEEPCLRCVDLVYQELLEMIHRSANQIYSERFPRLYSSIVDCVSHLLAQRLPVARRLVQHIINMEFSYINTMHPVFRQHVADQWFSDTNTMECDTQESPHRQDLTLRRPNTSDKNLHMDHLHFKSAFKKHRTNFLTMLLSPGVQDKPGQSGTVASAQMNTAQVSAQPSAQLSESEKKECRVIEGLIKVYFNIVKTSIQDSVPKAIMYQMVNNVTENVNQELIKTLFRADNHQDLLQEPQHVGQQRQTCARLLAALCNAQHILNDLKGVGFTA